jgi:uncharacterized protein (TIGR02118 family)
MAESGSERMLVATSNNIVACRSLAEDAQGTVYFDDRERWQHLPFRALLLADEAHRERLAAVADCGLYLVESRQLKVGQPSVVGLFPMVAHPQISPAEADRHWRDVHGPLALHHHAQMTSYIQLAVVEQISGPEFNGFALCGFASLADLREKFYSHPDSRNIIAADVARFADVKRSPARLIAGLESYC